jgi:hypothetical protein
MWAKNFKLVFFIPGPFQGGHFLGEIIYSSALDLKPTALNLRPAQTHHRRCWCHGALRVIYILRRALSLHATALGFMSL